MHKGNWIARPWKREQRLVYRELGQLQRLRKLRLGHCYSYFQWRNREYNPAVCDFLDTTSPDPVHNTVPEIKDLAIAAENKLVAPHAPSSTSHSTETMATTPRNVAGSANVTTFPKLSGSIASRAIVNASVYQHECLELSLDSGLDLMLQGTPRLEILEVPQMATRIGLEEVQAMVTAWPRLRILGLRSETEIDWKNEDELENEDGHSPTTVPRPRSISSDIIPTLLETLYHPEFPTLGQEKMIERRDMAQDGCLAWLREHYPKVAVRGADGDDELEVDDLSGDPWERWDDD